MDMTDLDELDKALLNCLQQCLPVCAAPFALIARQFSSSEAVVLSKLNAMLDSGLLTRFGPMFDAACLGGAFTLAAMAVPEQRFEQVTGLVNAFEQVAHNYRREHSLNMWFVIGTENEAEINEVIAAIEKITQLPVLNMPKQEEFYVGLYLPV